jgi:hypothetical protein
MCRLSPSEVDAPDRAGGNTPQAIEDRGNEPYRHRRTPELTIPQRAREQGKGANLAVRWHRRWKRYLTTSTIPATRRRAGSSCCRCTSTGVAIRAATTWTIRSSARGCTRRSCARAPTTTSATSSTSARQPPPTAVGADRRYRPHAGGTPRMNRRACPLCLTDVPGSSRRGARPAGRGPYRLPRAEAEPRPDGSVVRSHDDLGRSSGCGAGPATHSSRPALSSHIVD